MKRRSKRLLSVLLAVLMALTGVIPAATAFAGDGGVEGYYDIELFYKDTNTIVPSYVDETATDKEVYVETMTEGSKLNLTYQLMEGTVMPDNGYIKWYSEMPTLVDVDQDGVVKAFDSSKGAVVQNWIDNEVKPIPLVGSLMATALQKVLFNDTVDLDSMDTEAIINLVESAFGSDSVLSKWVDSYEGQLVDSLRKYLDNINSVIHVALYDASGNVLDDDSLRINVVKNDEWYANFLPNGTHITNKSQINTTVAVGSTVQLSAVTTPLRLHYSTMYTVKSTSIFQQGKVVATVNDSGLVTFKNKGTVTIVASPDTDEIINGILGLVNKFYSVNGTIDSDKIAGILIDYVGIDINRTVLAAMIDACFVVKDVVGGTTDPVQLTATAVELISNLVLQFIYNDSITFEVVDATPLESFEISGANTVQEGSQIQLTIDNIQPSTGDTSDIVWSSSDPSVASVDPTTGTITGRDAGGSLGSLSSKTCTITATSTTNNVVREMTLTVTGKTGKYLSDVQITGKNYLEIGEETDLSYEVYPSRVAQSDILYTTWGVVTGTDDDGNTTYSWATADTPATDGIGQITSAGHYSIVTGGKCTVALEAKTGYYLSNQKFYEISSYIATFEISNGIPVESIDITVSEALSAVLPAAEIKNSQTVTVNGEEYEYVSIKAKTAYAGVGAKLTATVSPDNASNKNLTWVVDNGYYSTKVSDDTFTAEVTQKAAHENADTFNVYAVSADGKVKSNVITVAVCKNNAATNVIDQDSIEVTRGKTADATHTITYDGSDGTYSACYKCNWYSSDEDVFTVATKNNDNRDATITAVDVGTATLYCVSADGGIVDTCEVTVYPDKEYIKKIVSLCEKTVIKRTSENRKLYNDYSRKLTRAYYIINDSLMASQATCDTYADELLYAFYKLGGFVGILGVDIIGQDGTVLTGEHTTVKVSTTGNYTKKSYDFDMQLKPSNAMYSSVEWSSSNSDITVDKNGTCTPASNNAGSAIITCTVRDYMGAETSASAFITFAKVVVTGVSLDTTSIVGGKIGETQTITATVTPKGTPGIGASCTDVYWSSSDENIATVDQNGVVTFKEGGDCVITCTTYDGGYAAQCSVNVVTNYTALENLVKSYNDQQLNYINYYPDSWDVYTAAMTKAQAMLDAADSSQAEVDAMVTELESAYNSLEKYNYIQKVELYLDGEQTKEFYQYDLSLLKEGISYKNAVLELKVRLYPNNGSYKTVTWESSNELINVDENGKCTITENKACYGKITCTVEDHFGNKFSDDVWVSFAFTPVTAVKVAPSSVTGEVGSTVQLSKTIEPTGSSLLHINSASITDCYWESDDESIATVDENGLVTFVSAGATTVRCVSYDGGIYGECQVSTEGDRSALKQALEDYKDVDYQDYAYTYGTAFKTAYDDANDALTDNTLSQDEIDAAAQALVSAYNAMIEHPYVHVTDATVTYTTAKKPLVGSWSDVATGTIGSSNALSVNISDTKTYSNYNNYNKVTLTAAPTPSDAMYKSVAWTVDEAVNVDSSADGATLTLTPSDKDKGARAAVTLTYTDEYGREFAKSYSIVMSDSTVTGFDITPSELTVKATDSASQIAYTLSGSPEITDIAWTSSDESVATVDSSGKLTPVEKGTAVITATTLDGGYTDSVTVNVITDFSALAAKQSEYYSLIQDVKDSYTYTQTSLDALSAVVDEAKTMIDDGKATQAEADAMLEKLNAAYESLVDYVAAESVKVGFESADGVTSTADGYIRYKNTISLNGKTVQLVANEQPENSVYKSVEWSSSNSNITVDENGLVTNNSATAGVTLITCKMTNELGDTFEGTAYVSFVRSGVTSVSFADEKVFGAPAKTATLSPTIKAENNATSSTSVCKECVYNSADPSIATVDENGVVTFVSQGSTTITATAKDGGYSATITAYTTWDTAALKAAIDSAASVEYTDYAYDYGTAFKTAYDNALTVYDTMDATQAQIDAACKALVEAQAALEGNEFVAPVVTVTQDGTALESGALVQVPEDTQQTVLTVSLNDGAMVKSTDISTTDCIGVTATVSGNDVTVVKTADEGAFDLVVKTTDDYGRETTTKYTFSVINTIVLATSVSLSVDNEVIGDDNKYVTTTSKASTFSAQLTYTAQPTGANAVKSVAYSSSNSKYVKIDSNGKISFETAGVAYFTLKKSVQTDITVTLTNIDGSTVTRTFNMTITQA